MKQKETTFKTQPLDLDQLEFTTEGLENYHWPIKIEDIRLICTNVRNGLSKLTQEAQLEDEKTSQLLQINILAISNLAMQMLHATLIKKRSEKEGIQFEPSKNFPILSMLQSGKNNKLHPHIKLLKYGPQPLKKSKLPLRLIRDILISLRNGIPRRRLFGINPKKNIITLGDHSLVQAWQKQQNAKITFLRVNYWFKSAKNTSIELDQNESALIKKTMTVIDPLFQQFGMELPKILEQNLQAFIEDSFLYSKHHLNVARQQNKIPHELWTNTGGSIWTRLLSILVAEHGGKVTGFDHAGGTAYFQDRSDYCLRELLLSQRFVTYSKSQADNLKEEVQACATLDLEPIEITSIQRPQLPSKDGKNIVTTNKPIKTIMYVATIYPSERVGTNGEFMSDLTMFDWQIRLFSKLNEMGYKLLFKPHPECPVQPPIELSTQLDLTIENGFFETMMNKADLFLFDSLCSTAFRHATGSQKPIVVVDFDLEKMLPEAKEMFMSRGEMIKGYFDDQNRAQTNWEELKSALENANNKSDNRFTEHCFYV